MDAQEAYNRRCKVQAKRAQKSKELLYGVVARELERRVKELPNATDQKIYRIATRKKWASSKFKTIFTKRTKEVLYACKGE